ncbi:MAG: hypothetical protein WC333_07235 [Dehalococcoidia bacterium]|jgi:hypothetical protein
MSLFKKIFALLLLPYAFWLVFAYGFHFIDWLNLFIHEGGHFLFTFFGDWLHVLGGTFAQLAVPLGIALYFLYRRQRYESAFCGFWFGESMMYMADYMADARLQALPLLGKGEHDWYWIFSRMGVLEHCQGIAMFFHVIASIIVLVSIGYMLYDAFKKKKPEEIPIGTLASIVDQAKKNDKPQSDQNGMDKPNWYVWRQDDNGNVALVKSGLTRTDALSLIAEYEAKGHKQTYWAQENE